MSEHYPLFVYASLSSCSQHPSCAVHRRRGHNHVPLYPFFSSAYLTELAYLQWVERSKMNGKCVRVCGESRQKTTVPTHTTRSTTAATATHRLHVVGNAPDSNRVGTGISNSKVEGTSHPQIHLTSVGGGKIPPFRPAPHALPPLLLPSITSLWLVTHQTPTESAPSSATTIKGRPIPQHFPIPSHYLWAKKDKPHPCTTISALITTNPSPKQLHGYLARDLGPHPQGMPFTHHTCCANLYFH